MAVSTLNIIQDYRVLHQLARCYELLGNVQAAKHYPVSLRVGWASGLSAFSIANKNFNMANIFLEWQAGRLRMAGGTPENGRRDA